MTDLFKKLFYQTSSADLQMNLVKIINKEISNNMMLDKSSISCFLDLSKIEQEFFSLYQKNIDQKQIEEIKLALEQKGWTVVIKNNNINHNNTNTNTNTSISLSPSPSPYIIWHLFCNKVLGPIRN